MDGDRAMKNVLEKYELKLTVRGPVFVGDGKEIDKKEYIFLSNGKVGVVDFARLYGLAESKGKAQALEKYMLEEYTTLDKWLRNERLYEDALRKALRYEINMGDNQLTRGSRTQIMSCIKDSMGNPYIPGSSIKGMLRTILGCEGLGKNARLKADLSGKLMREVDDAVRQGRVNRKAFLSRTSKEAETELFRTLDRPQTKPDNAVNDVLSGLIVGDSAPVAADRLVLVQKVERKVSGEEKTLNLLREAFMPGTEISFPLTIDRSVCSWDRSDIEAAIAVFTRVYNECFLSKFEGAPLLKPNQVLVGGGTGFVSKTLVYPLLGKQGVAATARIIDATLPPKLRDKHKHGQDARLGVSPHILKCTWFGGRTVQMGLCDLEIK